MDVCEWLNQVRKLDELIDAKIVERDQLFAMATRMTPNLDGMPHVKGTVSDPVGEAVVRLVAMGEEINKLIDRFVDQKKEVVRVLEQLPAKEYSVLHRYYIRYMTLEEIAADMNYSVMQIWRIKEKGLKMLLNVML